MKYFVGLVLALVVCLLFLPETGNTQIKNIPLLLALLFFALGIFIIKFLKYIVLMSKTKRILKQKGFKLVKFWAFPLGAGLHGRYNMLFQNEKEALNVVLLVRKNKYQHYFFKDIGHVEFYRANRVVFNSTKVKGATISNAVETRLVGRQKLKWIKDPTGSQSTSILLFDKLPFKISDSVKKEELGNGDQICSSNIRLYSLKGLQMLE